MIVPQIYEALLAGYDAAKITTRRCYLLQRGKRISGCSNNKKHRVLEKLFFALVAFVTSNMIKDQQIKETHICRQ